ncbi:SMI1/KNR4 family protein [Actinosynnema sp. NPDC049800]
MTGPDDAVSRTAAALEWWGRVSPELDWAAVESREGFRFPADYKEFMARFPSGLFRDVVRLHNPVQDQRSLAGFEDDLDRMLTVVEELREYDDSYAPFPEPRGVIPFADDVAGGALFWLPWTSDPDHWHVVHLSRGNHWTRTKRSMTAVMLELATSRSERNVLGWDLAAKDPVFEPFDQDP